jgi:flavin-dependent dehydrogenase
MRRRPITIVGGGLSGLTLGIQLRRQQVPVTLYEIKSYPHHRVCGEFISGLPDGLLEALDMEDLFLDAKRHRETGWVDRHGEVFHRLTLPKPALGLSRYQLDARMVQQFIDLGGDLRIERFSGSRQAEGIVDATGRSSDRSRAGDFLGLKCHVKNLSTPFDLEMHLGRGAYVGLSRVEEGAVNVCGLFPRLSVPPASKEGGGNGALMAHLRAAGLDDLAQRLDEAVPVEGSLCGTIHFIPGRQKKPPKVLAIGDALQQIPPFTGHGMAMAIESGAVAAAPLQAYATGTMSWDEAAGVIDQDLSRLFRFRLRLAQCLHPFLRSGRLPGIWKKLPFRRLAPTETLTGWLWGLEAGKAEV